MIRRGINQKEEIAKLKNGSAEYNKAIDDVLKLLEDIFKSCKIIHTQTGLYFNGYDSSFPKGKNTLSQSSSKSYLSYGKNDEEILELAFDGHIVEKENGKKYVRNKIVYKGSEIMKILGDIYSDTNYIPLSDFSIERK